MKKNLLFPCLLACSFAMAQSPGSNKSNIEPMFGLVQFEVDDNAQSFDLTYKKKTQNRGLVIESINYENGQLLVEVRLENFARLEKSNFRSASFEFEFCRIDENNPKRCSQIIKAESEALQIIANSEKKGSFTLTWPLVAERIRPFTGVFKMLTTARIEGDFVKILEEPTFKDKWLPHLIAGGVGLGMVATSFPMEIDADNVYDDYLQQLIKSEADPILAEANRKRRNYLTVRRIGYAVLAIDAVWLMVRYLKYNRDLKTYKDYELFHRKETQQKLSIKPTYQIRRQPNHPDFLGLQLKWSF